MAVISVGNKFQIFPDDLKTYGEIPKGTYVVRFNKMEGFSLVKRDDLDNQEKLYGIQEQKITKTLDTFNLSDRSLGVILSGDKGIGKTMFTRSLSERLREQFETPTIIVDTAYFGIADFLGSIKQEAMILFDEFEKVFDRNDENVEKQDSLLGLFDGTSNSKHLYVITVNDLYQLSSYMQNRTGRFHYHFRFEYPTGNEVKEYCLDYLDDEYKSEVDKIVSFSYKAKVTFDTLRAIIFELNRGYNFSETIQDLNISSDDSPRFEVYALEKGGSINLIAGNKSLDLFSSEVQLDIETDFGWVEVSFNPQELVMQDEETYVSNNLSYTPDRDSKELDAYMENITSIILKKKKANSIKYLV